MGVATVCLLIAMLALLHKANSEKERYKLTEEEQTHHLAEARKKCNITSADPPQYDVYCGMEFDRLLCWPYTRGGDEVTQLCPHIDGFYTKMMASRTCMSDGHWLQKRNKSWTNYSMCYSKPHSPIDHSVYQPHITIIGNIMKTGYTISLISLLVALFIMLFFRKLHCPRNTVHINLFLSFVLRCSTLLIKYSLFISNLGFGIDLSYNSKGNAVFVRGISHWQCKLFMALFHYCLSANYMWLFVEGLYLYLLLFVSVFSERKNLFWYIILGWVSPLLFVIPWTMVRLKLENELCWNTNPTSGYIWIINGPIILTILINCFFFIRIVKVLVAKLRDPNIRDSGRTRHIRLMKSTMVLIPLFGIYFVVLIWADPKLGVQVDIIILYIGSFLNSFQGFLISLLFCFMNGEVKSELQKKWQSLNLFRRGSGRLSGRSFQSNTMYSDITRARSSVNSFRDRDTMVSEVPLCSSLPVNTPPIREVVHITNTPVNGTSAASSPHQQHIDVPDKPSTPEKRMLLEHTVQNTELERCTVALVDQGESRL